MLLSAICEITFECSGPTPFILMLRPRSGVAQWVVREEYLLEPVADAVEYVDGFGNLCQRLIAPAGRFMIHTSAQVRTAATIDVHPGTPFTPVQELPDQVLPFLLPSRYCESDQFSAQALDIVGDAQPGYDQVEAIRAWIHREFTYQYGTSTTSTSALDTLQQRKGVCRDFAHLGIALCRSLSIPARMVVGYLHQLEPMDQHAWFEAFMGGRWYTFDATQAVPRGGRISTAYGRDAADVALATQFGPAQLTALLVQVEEVAVSE